jgi:hypothetical protein
MKVYFRKHNVQDHPDWQAFVVCPKVTRSVDTFPGWEMEQTTLRDVARDFAEYVERRHSESGYFASYKLEVLFIEE